MYAYMSILSFDVSKYSDVDLLMPANAGLYLDTRRLRFVYLLLDHVEVQRPTEGGRGARVPHTARCSVVG